MTKVPFNDLDAMERGDRKGDAACVIIESIPATYGFPLPHARLPRRRSRQTCEKVGTLFIADEVQTGLMRSGEMWCIDTYGVVPDMIVTGKGLSGGIYPIAAVIANETLGGVAQGGRLGPHVELRRRRARLHRRAQGDGDLLAAGDAVASATTSPTTSARASPRSRRTIPTSSSASASAG